MLEQQNPAQFRQVLEQYRRDLVSENKDGERAARRRSRNPRPAPRVVPLSRRLRRHQLRTRHVALSHAALDVARFRNWPARFRSGLADPGRRRTNSDEPFFRALRKVRERYAGKSISTQELIQVFEEELPRPLWYENRHKLDWFLEGWIEGTAIPELEAREIHITEKAGVTTVTGVIVQKDAPDDLVTAVPVYADTAQQRVGLSRRSACRWPGDRISPDCAERCAKDCARSEADDPHRPEVNSSDRFQDTRDLGARSSSSSDTCEALRLLEESSEQRRQYDSSTQLYRQPGRNLARSAANRAAAAHILLVEDEPFVRDATCSILERAGFAVLPPKMRAEAMNLCRRVPLRHRSGDDRHGPSRTKPDEQLGEELRQHSPDLPVLVTSGYANEEFDIGRSPNPTHYFLAKPYSQASPRRQNRKDPRSQTASPQRNPGSR